MIEEADARAQILAAIPEPLTEMVPIESALGRFAARELVARVAIPGFDNSAMDGYAVRAADAVAGAALRVVGEQAAGRGLGLKLQAGEAIRIFTGAAMPDGADSVVMQEDTEREGELVRASMRFRKPGNLCGGVGEIFVRGSGWWHLEIACRRSGSGYWHRRG